MEADYTFFNKIDSPEKAYILGFWCADGHLTIPKQCKTTFSIGFTSADFEHLNLIKCLMRLEHPVKITRDNCYRIVIGNKNLGKSLTDLGFDSNKSITAKYPPIKNELSSHFIRGVFDGDGCITRGFRKKDHRPYLDVHLCGTESLLYSINEKLPESASVRRHGENMYRIVFSQKKAFSVLKWIYEDSEGLRLKRKHDRYIEAINRTGFYLNTAYGLPI